MPTAVYECIGWAGQPNRHHDWTPVGLVQEAENWPPPPHKPGQVYAPSYKTVVVRACRNCPAHRVDDLYPVVVTEDRRPVAVATGG